MPSWKDRLKAATRQEVQEFSTESMAVHRIMRGLGSSVKEIGSLCRRFDIPYAEDESSFQRAVKILREVYPFMVMVDFVDAKSGKTHDTLYDELLDDPRTGMVFYRMHNSSAMTAMVKGLHLSTSALAEKVIKPGVRYLAERDGVELWEQDPVKLIEGFSTRKEE